MGTKTDIDSADENKKLDVETNELAEFGAEAVDEVIEQADEPKFVDPRAEAMARMVQQSSSERKIAKDEFKDEFGFHPDDSAAKETAQEGVEDTEQGDVEDAATDTAQENVQDVAVDNGGQTSDNPITSHDGQQFIKLKVNGAEQEMSIADAQAALQKGKNADRMMQEAAQQRKLYEDLIAQQQAQTHSTPPDEQPVVSVNTNEVLKDALTKMYDGEVDEAAEKLGSILQQPQQPQVDVGKLVDERIAQQAAHNNLRSAYDKFVSNDEFAGIAGDPVLLQQVDTMTETLQQDPEFQATNPSYEDYFHEAGRRVNAWVDKLTPKTTVADVQDVEAEKRVERKRSTTQQPQSRTVRRSPAPEQKPKGRHDILADMAAARGQSNFN